MTYPLGAMRAFDSDSVSAPTLLPSVAPQLSMTPFSNSSDSQFGPAYSGQLRSFDFTLLFEDTILTIVPATIFLLAAGTRAVWLTGKPTKVGTSLSRSTKLVSLPPYLLSQRADAY
jgi:hypothetical protein